MFKCDKCEYETKNKHDLKRHIKSIHDKIKDFKCNKCEYKCSNNNDLKEHTKRIHDKIKDNKCDKCEYTCLKKSHLKQHIKYVHDKVKDFTCKTCNYCCTTNSDMNKHIKQVHDKIKDIKCSKCDYKCSNTVDMKSHNKKVHERPIMDKHMSLGEYAIYDYLTKNNIEFEKEMKFKNLVSPKNSPLRYDFYIKSHNLLIEFDGKQHFEKVRWTKEHTENEINERYNFLIECDHLKNEYADANKIKLYRIKYTEIKNIENILKVLLI
jgi:hypothetical protein